jgi:hypothetical protein
MSAWRLQERNDLVATLNVALLDDVNTLPLLSWRSRCRHHA